VQWTCQSVKQLTFGIGAFGGRIRMCSAGICWFYGYRTTEVTDWQSLGSSESGLLVAWEDRLGSGGRANEKTKKQPHVDEKNKQQDSEAISQTAVL
jgi:hypothetical protein